MTPRTMTGAFALVTGANVGIGKETARGLAAAGATTVLLCRSIERGEAAAQDLRKSGEDLDVQVVECDLGSLASIRRAAATLGDRFPAIDILVNNAGLWTTSRTVTADGLETTLGVNHFGHYALTGLLLPALLAAPAARVVNVSSMIHNAGVVPWDDLQSERWYNARTAYNNSKLANVLFTYALARRLAGTSVTTNALHPGVIATQLWRSMPAPLRVAARLFFKSPRSGAATSLYLALDPAVAGVSGRYFSDCKETRSSPASYIEADQERLWTISEELTGVRYPLATAVA